MPIYENMPEAEYFAIEAASNSGLKKIMRSPAHFRYPPPERGDKRNLEIGKAIHMALLEPGRFDAHYLVAESDDRKSAFYKGLAKDVGGDRVLTRIEHANISGMRRSAYANRRFAKLMQMSGRNELSVTATDPETGAPVKCRFDRKGDGMWALDVKKCQDARQNEFMRTITAYGYHMQVAFYTDVWFWATGEKMNASGAFPLVAIEEDSPHGCILHDLDDVAVMVGRAQYREALNTYARCLEKGEWPAYEDESTINSVSPWLADQIFDTMEGE